MRFLKHALSSIGYEMQMCLVYVRHPSTSPFRAPLTGGEICWILEPNFS